MGALLMASIILIEYLLLVKSDKVEVKSQSPWKLFSVKTFLTKRKISSF